MTTGMKMFLSAAQELNFTRAAEKAYVTPQCLSDHIKRLEAEYGVTLFERRPHLSLTPEGKAMFRYFSEIQALEASMENELAEISGGTRGRLRLGIPTTRGQLFIPQVIPEFQKQYPLVKIEIQLNDTRALEPLLLEGKLDLIMGVDANPNPLLERINVCHEPLYTVLPFCIMQEKYGDSCGEKIVQYRQNGLPIQELSDIPLITGGGISTTSTAIQAFLLENGIRKESPIVVSNFDILLELCLSGNYATICLLSNLGRLLHEEKTHLWQNILVFPIRDCRVALPVELLYRRYERSFPFQKVLIKMLTEAVLRENELITHSLLHSPSPSAIMFNN